MGIKRLKKSRTIRVLIKRDIERQADRHTNSLFSLKSMVLVMTFNIIYIYIFYPGFLLTRIHESQDCSGRETLL